MGIYNKVSDRFISSRIVYIVRIACIYLCIVDEIIYHQFIIFIKLRWDLENNLSLKDVVVSFQTLKTAKWRINGTEKIDACRPRTQETIMLLISLLKLLKYFIYICKFQNKSPTYQGISAPGSPC